MPYIKLKTLVLAAGLVTTGAYAGYYCCPVSYGITVAAFSVETPLFVMKFVPVNLEYHKINAHIAAVAGTNNINSKKHMDVKAGLDEMTSKQIYDLKISQNAVDVMAQGIANFNTPPKELSKNKNGLCSVRKNTRGLSNGNDLLDVSQHIFRVDGETYSFYENTTKALFSQLNPKPYVYENGQWAEKQEMDAGEIIEAVLNENSIASRHSYFNMSDLPSNKISNMNYSRVLNSFLFSPLPAQKASRSTFADQKFKLLSNKYMLNSLSAKRINNEANLRNVVLSDGNKELVSVQNAMLDFYTHGLWKGVKQLNKPLTDAELLNTLVESQTVGQNPEWVGVDAAVAGQFGEALERDQIKIELLISKVRSERLKEKKLMTSALVPILTSKTKQRLKRDIIEQLNRVVQVTQ